MDAGGVAVQTPSPHRLPHVLWICPCILACPGGWKPVQVHPGVCLGVGSQIPSFRESLLRASLQVVLPQLWRCFQN